MESKAFPQSLEERIKAISTVLNSELKIATLVALNDGLVHGIDVSTRIKKLTNCVSYDDLRLTAGGNFLGYCRESFLPVGIVAQEQGQRDDGKSYVGYKITEEGKRYGVPLALSSLRWAVENNLSLYSLLGCSSSGGKSKSPSNRLRILRYLADNIGKRKVDIASTVGLGIPNVTEHLKNLKQIGFVEYESIKPQHPGQFTYTYKNTSGASAQVSEFTLKVLEAMKKLRTANNSQVSEELGYEWPSNVSKSLSQLAERHLLVRNGVFIGRERYSIVNITEFGRKFLKEQFNVWKEVLSDGKALVNLQRDAYSFLRDNQRLSTCLRDGINNYWEVSPNGNEVSSDETKKQIIQFIKGHGSARASELTRFKSAKHSLTSLTNKGILKRKERGVYVVNEAESKL